MMVIYCKYDRYAVRKSLVEWIYYMKRIILKCIMSRWGKSMEVNLLTSIRSNEYQLTMYFCVYMTLCVKRWRFFPGSAFITFTQLCAHAPLSGFLSQCDLCLIFRLNWQSIMFTNAVNLLRRVKAIYVVWENKKKKHFNRGGLSLSQILPLCSKLLFIVVWKCLNNIVRANMYKFYVYITPCYIVLINASLIYNLWPL